MLSVPCPFCGMPAGMPCITAWGAPSPGTSHPERVGRLPRVERSAVDEAMERAAIERGRLARDALEGRERYC